MTQEESRNQKLNNLVSTYKAGAKPAPDAAWERFSKEANLSDAGVKKRSIVRRMWPVAAAIIVLVCFGIGFGVSGSKTVLATNEEIALTLPDQSHVALAKGSSITYKRFFFNRQVTLQGEAFFKVSKQANRKSFEIKAGDASIVVLGTSFNVRMNPNDQSVDVQVKTGKVQCKNQTPNTLILTPKQAARIHSQDFVEYTIPNPDWIGTWTAPTYLINGQKVSEVLQWLAVAHGVTVTLDKNSPIGDCKLTTRIDSRDPQKAIQTILDLFGAEKRLQKTSKGAYLIEGGYCK